MPVIHHLESCESTMNEARALARGGAEPFTTVWADEQTAGRGRQGRAWQSERGVGLYATVILPSGLQTALAPMLVGVALVEAIRLETGVPARLKWPNDVLIPDGRKLAGVLLERDARSGALLAGFGVNLKTRDFQGLFAVALEDCLARPVDCRGLLESVLERLQTWSETITHQGDGVLLERWRALDLTLGREVVIHAANGSSFTGTAEDIEPDGRLRVHTNDGFRVVSSGEVSLRFAVTARA